MAFDAKGNRRRKSRLREYAEIIVTAAALALLVRALIIQSYHIPSQSMEDTLLKGDFLFANKFLYGARVPFIGWRFPKIRDPKPGDVVIFKYPGDRTTDYIKRCVAVEGQTVELRGTRLFLDGVEQPEPFAVYKNADAFRRDFGPYVVPKGHIVVFGDNRDQSSDSRHWGPLDKKLLCGRAFVIYLSLDYQKHGIRFARIGDLIR